MAHPEYRIPRGRESMPIPIRTLELLKRGLGECGLGLGLALDGVCRRRGGVLGIGAVLAAAPGRVVVLPRRGLRRRRRFSGWWWWWWW